MEVGQRMPQGQREHGRQEAGQQFDQAHQALRTTREH